MPQIHGKEKIIQTKRESISMETLTNSKKRWLGLAPTFTFVFTILPNVFPKGLTFFMFY